MIIKVENILERYTQLKSLIINHDNKSLHKKVALAQQVK